MTIPPRPSPQPPMQPEPPGGVRDLPAILAAAAHAARWRAIYYQRRREKDSLAKSLAENEAHQEFIDANERLRELISVSINPPLFWKTLVNEADERLFGRVCAACAKRYPVEGEEPRQNLCPGCRRLRSVEERRGRSVTTFRCCDRTALGSGIICPCQATTISRNDDPPLRDRSPLVSAMLKRDRLEDVALGEGFLDVIPGDQSVLGECPDCSYFGELINHQYRRVFCPVCPRTDSTHEGLKDKPAIVYLIEFNLSHQRFVKIGISLKYAAKQRLAGHARGGGRLAQLVETTHGHAVAAERQILNKYRKVKVRPIIPLPAAGDTECLAWSARTMDLAVEVKAILQSE